MKLRKHTRRVHHKKQPASVEHNWQKSEITTKKIRSYRVPVKNLITLLTLRHLGLLPRTDGQKAKCFSYKHSFPKLIWYSRGKLLRFSPAESVLSIMYASFLWLVRHVLQIREIESRSKKKIPFLFGELLCSIQSCGRETRAATCRSVLLAGPRLDFIHLSKQSRVNFISQKHNKTRHFVHQ